jgi:hypothetical protein
VDGEGLDAAPNGPLTVKVPRATCRRSPRPRAGHRPPARPRCAATASS